MSGFWQLPAPSRFLQDATDHLAQGHNVVITFPRHVPEGWLPRLRAHMRTLGLCPLETVAANGSHPAAAILNYLRVGVGPSKLRLSHLCEMAEFQGRIIYLSEHSDANWPAWRNFLMEYEDACRMCNGLAQRTVFLTSLHGELAAGAPAPANLLRVYHWHECMDNLNICLHAANLLADREFLPWQRQLAVAVLSELALWDPLVCEYGASRDFAEILEPQNWLAQLGNSRGWVPSLDRQQRNPDWLGYRQRFEGHDRWHSAWLALIGRNESLAVRVWNGQVSAIFPLLERHRRGLISIYGRILKVPWTTGYGTIDQIEDLELNHIADQLDSQRSSGLRETAAFVRWLRDLRNTLAHLAPIPASRLLDHRFQSRFSDAEQADDYY